jgi:hypothetical protein
MISSCCRFFSIVVDNNNNDSIYSTMYCFGSAKESWNLKIFHFKGFEIFDSDLDFSVMI